MSQYNPAISKQKGTQGTLEGSVATLIGIGMLVLVKKLLGENIPDGIEDSIASLSGIITGGIFVGVRRFIVNRKKHKLCRCPVPSGYLEEPVCRRCGLKKPKKIIVK